MVDISFWKRSFLYSSILVAFTILLLSFFPSQPVFTVQALLSLLLMFSTSVLVWLLVLERPVFSPILFLTLFVGLASVFWVVGANQGFPLGAHGKEPNCMNYLGFGGGTLPRFAMAVSGFVIAAYLRKECLDWKLMCGFYLILVVGFFMLSGGVFLATFFFWGVWATSMNPIAGWIEDRLLYVNFAAQWYVIFLGRLFHNPGLFDAIQGYSFRGVLLYAFSSVLLTLSNRICSTRAVKSLWFAVWLPLFARGITRICDTQLEIKLVPTFMTGVILGLVPVYFFLLIQMLLNKSEIE